MITDVSNLTPEQRAAVPAAPGVPAPVIPIPSATPDQQEAAPDQQPAGAPTQALPLTALGQAPSLTPPQAPGQEPSHVEKVGTIAAQVPTPPGPGGWAKVLVASARSALQSMQTGLGDMETANEEVARSHPYGGAGALDYIGAQANAKAARLQAAKVAQTVEDRQRSEISKINIDTHWQQILIHQAKDKFNHDDAANGQLAVSAATAGDPAHGVKGAPIIKADVEDSQLPSLIASGVYDPTTMTPWPTRVVPVIDTQTGKQKIDDQGDPQFKKLWTIVGTPKDVILTPDQAKFLADNNVVSSTGENWEAGQKLPGSSAMMMFQQASNNQSLAAKVESDRQDAELADATKEQKIAMVEAQKNLGPDFFHIAAQLSLADQMKFVTGQHMSPDPTGKNPNGISDPRSVKFSQEHSNAAVDLQNVYGGPKDFLEADLKQRKDSQPDVAVKDLPKNEQEAAAQTSAAQTAYDKNPTPANKAALDRATGIQTSIKTVVQNERQYSSNLQKQNNEASKGISQTNELAKKGFDDINKQWTDLSHGFSGALAQINNTKNAIQAGADGSGLMTSMVPTMEVLGINHAAGISRISPAEAIAAGMPGGFAERWNAWGTKAATGRLTPELAKEGRQLMDIIIRSKYSQSLQSTRMLAANSGIDTNQVTVLDIDGQPATLASRIKIATPPPGATGTAPDPKTGKLWWHDAKGVKPLDRRNNNVGCEQSSTA